MTSGRSDQKVVREKKHRDQGLNIGVKFFLLSEGILTVDAYKKVLKHYNILLMDLSGAWENRAKKKSMLFFFVFLIFR
jgi:IS4 transposase